MFHRREKPFQVGAPGAKRLKARIENLAFTNQIPLADAAGLAVDAAAAGVPMGRLGKVKPGHNVARSTLRALAHGTRWPPTYEAEVRVWDPKQQRGTTAKCPMLLPHEVLFAFAMHNASEVLHDIRNMGVQTYQHLVTMNERFGADGLAYGFWLDGCPCNWDRTESLEALTMSLPGLGGDNKNVRVPLAVLPKRFMLTVDSWDDIMNVMRWSAEHLALGSFPSKRHDDAAFSADVWRRRHAGQELGESWHTYTYCCFCTGEEASLREEACLLLCPTCFFFSHGALRSGGSSVKFEEIGR